MIKKYFKYIKEICDKIDRNPIGALINELYELQKRKGRLFILGVGGSAANASHMANDFRKLCEIETYCPTDNVSELTARTNDEGWDSTFEAWLKGCNLISKDMVFVLSVGGGNEKKKISMNIVKALKYAKKQNCFIGGIVGRDGGYTKKVANACVLIPTINQYLVTPFAESFQAVIWHLLVFHPTLNINNGKWESVSLK